MGAGDRAGRGEGRGRGQEKGEVVAWGGSNCWGVEEGTTRAFCLQDKTVWSERGGDEEEEE